MPTIECGAPSPELLIAIGPTVSVRIGFDPNYQPNDRLPQIPEDQYHALIDTGALAGCIDSSIAAGLNLPIVDRVQGAGVGGREEFNMHLAQVVIPDLAFVLYGGFMGVHLYAGGQPHGALLGRTFLRQFSLEYNGESGLVTLTR